MTPLNFKEFEKFRDLIYQHTSLFFTEKKKAFLESKLRQRVEALNLSSYEAYYQLLKEEKTSSKELSALIETLVIPETSFFRIRGHFLELERRIFPELLAQRSRENQSLHLFQKPRMRIWSVACSTGEEPYSIAMSLLEVLQDPASWDIEILATDISNSALAKARRGLYSKDKVKKVDPRYLSKYFKEQGEKEYKIAEVIQHWIRFQYLNLADVDKFPSASYDLIFCRNVLIYFDRKAQDLLMERVTNLLLPGGYLFLGDAEPLHTFPQIAKKFEFIEIEDAMIYRKK
jgi:chemotaxis protein methyltransferase CheR